MPANEFEKQVQQKMDEFQLEPSASVWQKVEEEIRRKKRRRIIFFFILPAAIALITLPVYFLTNTSNTKNGIVPEQAISNEKQPGNSDKIKSTEKNETVTENNIPPSLKKETGLSNTHTDKKAGQEPYITPGKNNVQLSTAIPGKNRPGAAKKNNIMKSNLREVKQDNSLVISNDIPIKQTLVKPAEDGESNKDKNIVEPKIIETDTNKEDPAVEQKNPGQIKTDSIASKDIAKSNEQKEMIPKKKTAESKIKWGIDFSAGSSGSSENTFSFGSFENKSRNNLLNSPGSSTGTPAAPRITLAPSSVYPGISFKMGITAELQTSKKSRVSTGLQYAYLSNRVNTGGRQDSTINLYNNNYSTAQVDVFYRGAQRNKYTDRFQFIQVPLWYHLQLNKGKKLPLQWNVGLSLAYLFSTNGLVYDTSYGGIYYRNNEVYNKFHLNIGTGLSFRLKAKNGSEWILGPELSFDMKKLINNPLDKKQYLMYGGINTRFLLPKKKK